MFPTRSTVPVEEAIATLEVPIPTIPFAATKSDVVALDCTANEGVFGIVDEPTEKSAHGVEVPTPTFPPVFGLVIRNEGLEEPVMPAKKSGVLDEEAPKSPEPTVSRASGLEVPIPTLPAWLAEPM